MKKEKPTTVLSEEELKRKKKIDVLDYIITLCSIVLVFFTIFYFLQVATVPSTSMYPTLKIKELVLVQRIHGDPENKLNYGDIVTFTFHSANGDRLFVKRLIGMPGDTIEVTSNSIIRNGEVIEDPYRLEYVMDFPMEEITLADDEYFLMGDNRNNSSDCRVFGPVKEEDILGRVFFHTDLFEDENCNAFVNSVPEEDRNPEFTMP